MRRRFAVLSVLGLLAGAACAHNSQPATPRVTALNSRQLDSLWARAEGLLARKKWTEAGIALDRVLLELPFADPRIPKLHLDLGESYLGDKSNLLAVREFRRVADEYPGDSLAPLALLRAGDAYSGLWTRPELDASDGMSAMSVYQEMVTRYPNTPYAKQANESIARLEDKFARKLMGTADYYLRYKAYDSAIIYLRDILATYPKTTITPDVITRLIGAYRVLEYKADVAEACAYLRLNYPKTPKLDATCPQPASGGKPPAP